MVELSVVICTYNRAKWIGEALKSCVNQSLDVGRYEVLVINNNCTDGTTALVDAFIAEHPNTQFRQIIETNQGLSFARNKGIDEARSELITYIDDDAIADFELFERILDHFQNHSNVVGLAGKVIPKFEGTAPKWLNPYLNMMVTLIDYGSQSFRCEGKKYPPGCNMSYRKGVLKQVGGFNNALKWRVDDKYIFREVEKVSKEIYFLPTLMVQHNIDEERTSDANFDNLSLKLGHEERIRVKAESKLKYILKIGEYKAKWLASIALGSWFAINGEWIKGRYIIRFRWKALLGLLNFQHY
ncbi:MAG: glycosyltransferase involved in cell wall biosynthesis [Bacteroidia bacterium]|jgi:glycosyltransferase involved in cell wall biosynthesis